jgi:hypothetical protein
MNSRTRSISNSRISSKIISRISIRVISPRLIEYIYTNYIESYVLEAFILLRITRKNHMLKFLLILLKKKISMFGLIIISTNY